MAILTDSGRAAVANSIKAQPIHLAWGSGSVDWDDGYSDRFRPRCGR
nr:MAG TPA: baseplate protein [Caudoviricetes sp.]